MVVGWFVRAPTEDGEIVSPFDDLILETPEGLGSLAVEHGHADVEQAEQAVGPVLDPSGSSARCPRHALSHGEVAQWQEPDDVAFWYVRGLGKTVDQTPLCANQPPRRVVKVDASWSNELLKSPTSTEPLARTERRAVIRTVVAEKDNADERLAVPLKHGVDGFDELGTARLVDTASVDQIYSNPRPRVVSQAFLILTKPCLACREDGTPSSWKETSPSSQV